MDASEIARRRMRAQRLSGAPVAKAEDVVAHLGAMQAQELTYAKWSVAQRTKGVGEEAMDRLLAEGAILRTHALRPTWHFVLPADIRWIQALTGPRIQAGAAARYRELGLDGKILDRAMRAFAKAVEGGRHRTRKELAGALSGHRIDVGGQRLPWLLMHAELEALLCSGAPKGNQQTYALVEERAPGAETLDPDEALAELIRRYFRSHGPATVNDLAWWSSLKVADIRRGLEMVGSELASREMEGRTYWFGSGERRPHTPPGAVSLVQVYDEAVVAYRESRDVVATSGLVAERPGFMHWVLADGREAGRWRRVRTKDGYRVEVALRRRMGRASLEREIERYMAFLGAPVELVRVRD